MDRAIMKAVDLEMRLDRLQGEVSWDAGGKGTRKRELFELGRQHDGTRDSRKGQVQSFADFTLTPCGLFALSTFYTAASVSAIIFFVQLPRSHGRLPMVRELCGSGRGPSQPLQAPSHFPHFDLFLFFVRTVRICIVSHIQPNLCGCPE